MEETQAIILSLGPFAPVGFMLVLAVVVVISPLPGWPLVVASPAMFGLVKGVLYSSLGVGLGAAIAFGLARRFGRPAVLRFWPEEKVAALEKKLSGRQQLLALFALRLMPISPFDLINYAAGLTSIPFRYFILVTLIGVLPANFVLAYSGQAGLTANGRGLVILASILLLLVIFWPRLWSRIR